MRSSLTRALIAVLAMSAPATAQNVERTEQPTIVLVHGAFAESSSWAGVISRLEGDGYRVIAAANPLRGVASDGAAVAAIVKAVEGKVVLVGHSYGGPVITEAAVKSPNVTALVYVAGFAPDTGESSFTLSAKFPGSTLGETLISVPLPDGGEDLYIRADKFHAQFAADVPAHQAAVMAATQRPITMSALQEASTTAAWKTLPSYMIYGTEDRNIPPQIMGFMAIRAGARKAEVVEGASHALMVSHPARVAAMIEAAAAGE
jgi:pimeloyl-ACP methyl ester carboxylesterase